MNLSWPVTIWLVLSWGYYIGFEVFARGLRLRHATPREIELFAGCVYPILNKDELCNHASRTFQNCR